MKYQNDYPGYIEHDGCLLCSIVTAVEQLTGCEFSRDHFLDFVNRLHCSLRASYDNSLPVLSDENDTTKPGAFVWDHEAVWNQAFHELGSSHKMRYTGRIYMPWEEARGKKSFGERGGDILILHIQTPNTGHFRLPNFDPWKPGTKMVDMKSLRYNAIV